MSDVGPRPLLEQGSDVSRDLLEALRAARQDLPGADQLGALAARLPLGPGPGGGPEGGGDGGSAGGDGGTGAATGSAVGLSGATAFKAAAVLLVAAVGGAAVWSVATTPADRPAERDSTERPAVAPTPDPPSPPAPGAPPAAVEPPSESPSFEPPPTEGPSKRRSPPAPVTSTSDPPAPEPPDPTAELGLLRQAQDALSSSPSRSLSLVGQHGELFPASALAQEREVLAVEALVRLGRSGPARARADRFRRRWPSSSHVPRIDRLTGAAPRSDAGPEGGAE